MDNKLTGMQYQEPEQGALTESMDTNSEEFSDFQAILLNKSRDLSEAGKRKIEMKALQFRMEDYLRSDNQTIVLPGEFLKVFLKIIGTRQNKFARYIGLKPSNFSKLLSGERSISFEIAIILGNIFNHDPMLWLQIQAKNEIKRLTQSDDNRFKDFTLHGLLSA